MRKQILDGNRHANRMRKPPGRFCSPAAASAAGGKPSANNELFSLSRSKKRDASLILGAAACHGSKRTVLALRATIFLAAPHSKPCSLAHLQGDCNFVLATLATLANAAKGFAAAESCELRLTLAASLGGACVRHAAEHPLLFGCHLFDCCDNFVYILVGQ